MAECLLKVTCLHKIDMGKWWNLIGIAAYAAVSIFIFVIIGYIMVKFIYSYQAIGRATDLLDSASTVFCLMPMAGQ